MRVVAPSGLIADRYRLLSPLGSGSSATVWAAADETLGRRVALKLLSSAAATEADEGGSKSADKREQSRREARALAALTHPHIIVVFDFLETPGLDGAVQPVLVTELLEGRSLGARLAEGPLPWPEALSVCGQLASALAAAHRAGIVHRDVAPANVMLTGSGVKLLDFGLAETITTAKVPTDDGMTAGTPVCMAPEQLMGNGALPASDVYALGCVLHWCLTGRPPYRARDLIWLSRAHLRAEPPPLTIDGLPEGINELYFASLAKEPDERPTAEEAAATLGPYVSASAAASMSAAPASASASASMSTAASASASAGAPLAESAVDGTSTVAFASSRTYAPAPSAASASADRQSPDNDATELLSMLVSDGVATYVGPGTDAGAVTNVAANAADDAATDMPSDAPADTPPSPPAPGRHASSGGPMDRRRLLPLAVSLAAIVIIALMTFGVARTMEGTGTSATRATGTATGSAAPPAGSSATTTVGTVVLSGPGGSAARSASTSASPSASLTASSSASASASASGSASASASSSVPASPSMSPSQGATTAVALAPLPDPAADPLGYVQALGTQVRALIAQGPGTLQPVAGQNLLNSLGGLQKLVVAAQQRPGDKQWHDVANNIAAIQRQVSNDAAAGQVSASAANLLVGELQSLASSLPATSPNGNRNGAGNGN